MKTQADGANVASVLAHLRSGGLALGKKTETTILMARSTTRSLPARVFGEGR